MDPIDLSRVRRLYRDGTNVVDYLKRQLGSHVNTEQVIEIAYDMQAGSYVEHFRKHFATEMVYHRELAEVVGRYLAPGDSVLDVGTGEMIQEGIPILSRDKGIGASILDTEG